MATREDILAVMQDGTRIDRFLQITCVDDPPCDLLLTTEDASRVQFRVPPWAADADEIIERATAYLLENS
ncbi:MAG: hypothetical protein ACO3JL_21970 [Myxococcota bacterium]